METQTSRLADRYRSPNETRLSMEFDTVEFVMTVEERFGTSIPDSDAELIQTVGDLCDYLAARVRLFRYSTCPTATAFYLLNRTLANHRIDSKKLHPTDDVSTVVPPENRAAAWNAIRDAFGTTPPSLRWRPLVSVLYLVYLVLVIAVHTLFVVSSIESLPLLVAIAISGSISGIAGYILADRFACVVPQSVTTVGDLVRLLTSQAYLSINDTIDNVDAWIYDGIVECVSACSDLTPKNVTRNTHFVNDLY